MIKRIKIIKIFSLVLLAGGLLLLLYFYISSKFSIFPENSSQVIVLASDNLPRMYKEKMFESADLRKLSFSMFEIDKNSKINRIGRTDMSFPYQSRYNETRIFCTGYGSNIWVFQNNSNLGLSLLSVGKILKNNELNIPSVSI